MASDNSILHLVYYWISGLWLSQNIKKRTHHLRRKWICFQPKDESGTFFIGVLSRCLPHFHVQDRNRSNFQNFKFCLDRNPIVLNTVIGSYGYKRKTYRNPTYTQFPISKSKNFLNKLLCFLTVSTVLLLFKTYNISETGICLCLQVEPEIMR
jgi:hypothetical protein